jgi:hypothetical protein
MTAEEHDGERVVATNGPLAGCHRGRLARGLEDRDRLLALTPRGFGAPVIDQPTGGDSEQPRTRILRDPLARPLRRRGQQRFLNGVLARLELAVTTDKRAEDQRRAATQQILGFAVDPHISSPEPCISARTSIPPTSVVGQRPATSSARSRSQSSNR